MELIFQKVIGVNGIESGITDEGMGIECIVQRKKVVQDRFERRGIANGLVLIRRVGFLVDSDFRVSINKFIIKESNMSDDAEPVSDDGEFIGITKMTVDVLLFSVRGRLSVCRHEPVSHFNRVNVGIVFVMSFQATNERVERFRIIFFDEKFDTRSVKEDCIGKLSVDGVAERFSEVDELVEHLLKPRVEILFKASEQRCVGNFFVEAAELT